MPAMFSYDLRGGYTQEQLETAFKKVQNKEHWKGRINALVNGDEDLDLILFAISYFTGTEGYTLAPRKDGKIRVRAPGYWAGPCN